MATKGSVGSEVDAGARADAATPAGPLEDAWGIFGERHLPYRVLMLGKMIERLSVQQVRDDGGLALAEWRVLAHIAAMGPRSAAQISVAALVDRAEVSRAVKALEAAGLIARLGNPRNRKSSLLVLTAQGQALYDRMSLKRRAVYAVLNEGIAAEELALLDRLLFKMARNADRLAREGMPQQAQGGPVVRAADPLD